MTTGPTPCWRALTRSCTCCTRWTRSRRRGRVTPRRRVTTPAPGRRVPTPSPPRSSGPARCATTSATVGDHPLRTTTAAEYRRRLFLPRRRPPPPPEPVAPAADGPVHVVPHWRDLLAVLVDLPDGQMLAV